MDKTEDDALRRVKISEPGSGVEAYQRLYKWYSGVSGMGLMERARAVQNPTPPKREEDTALAIEKRLEQVQGLEKHGPQYRVGIVFRVTVLRSLLIGRG